MRKIMICGATSAIAREAARYFAAVGDHLYLVARDADKLEAIATDLRARGAGNVQCRAQDLLREAQHGDLLEAGRTALGGLDVVLVAYGVLGNQEAAEQDHQVARQVLETNLLSVISLLTPVANMFEAQGHGIIAVISSVAGDRGRAANYVYGTAKGGLNVFLQGLRQRLARRGVTVITIKPGFVDTPMTAHMKKGLLFASAESVGLGVYRAVRSRRDVVYLPGFWRPLMGVVRAIPEPLFKRMKF